MYTIEWLNTDQVITFRVILKIVSNIFLPFFGTKVIMNYGTFDIKILFNGFGIGSTIFKKE